MSPAGCPGGLGSGWVNLNRATRVEKGMRERERENDIEKEMGRERRERGIARKREREREIANNSQAKINVF